jgi:hypothetical protein
MDGAETYAPLCPVLHCETVRDTASTGFGSIPAPVDAPYRT